MTIAEYLKKYKLDNKRYAILFAKPYFGSVVVVQQTRMPPVRYRVHYNGASVTFGAPETMNNYLQRKFGPEFVIPLTAGVR